MKRYLVDKSKLISFNFYVGLNKEGKLIASPKPFSENAGVTEVETHTVKVRKAGYRDNVEILSKTMRTVDDKVTMDPALLRYERFCALVVEWTLTDDENKPISASRENIDELEQEIATAILDAYEAKLVEID